MYTFNPLPVIDTLNAHGGFWTLAFVLILLNVIWFIGSIDFGEYKGFFILCLLSILALNYVGFQSWTTGTINTPKNEKVTGLFKGYMGEGEAYYTKSGKTTVRREDHYLYVIYTIEGQGDAVFSANKGTVYPERVTIYKN